MLLRGSNISHFFRVVFRISPYGLQLWASKGYAKLKYPSEMPQLPKPKVAQLQKIYVLRDFLGQGVGPPLLQAACDCAAALEVDTVWLTVLAENKRAIRFYQRHGFAVLTQTTFSIGAQTFDFDVLRKDIGIMSLSGVHGAVSR